jgi:lipopolysaccharide transport system permease protein
LTANPWHPASHLSAFYKQSREVQHNVSSVETIDHRNLAAVDRDVPPGPLSGEWVIYAPAGARHNPLVLLRQSLANFWTTRELAWILFTRDLKSQVRRSFLGYAWLFTGPLVTAAMWVFLRSQEVVSVETTIPYPLFVLSGTILWSLFRAGFDATVDVYSSDILKKLNVPIEAFIARNLANVAFQFLLAVIPLACLFVAYRMLPAATVLLLPVAVAGLVLMGAAAGCFLAPLASLYGDVGRMMHIGFTGLMYLSPVVYPPRDTGWLGALMHWNPLTPVLNLCRELLFGGQAQPIFPAAATVAVAAAMLLAGLILLHVARPHVIARKGM